MPVELRKRKAADPAPTPAPAKKKGPVAKVADKVKAAVTGSSEPTKTNGAPKSSGKVAVGQTISLDSFGGEVETHEGQKTTLKKLVEESKAGVVLFTYPKASTPGCTKQACIFRDEYTPLTATGYSIFGLSTDSPKSNTTFKTKQNLPYSLLCDPSATLIGAIGMKKPPKSTTRGVFVVDKSGKILAAEPGGPDATVEVVRKLVAGSPGETVTAESKGDETKVEESANGTAPALERELTKEDVQKAEVAADVADTAEKLDSNEAKAT